MAREPGFARRLRTALSLTLTLRARDLRSGERFMNMRFAGEPLLRRAARTFAWAFDVAWRRAPDAGRSYTRGAGVSPVPYWLSGGNPWQGHSARAGGTLPVDAEVVVVGAGFGGASVAYHWSREGDGRLVVLERHAPASGAAGRNAGFLTTAGGSYHGYYVFEPVRAFAALARPELEPAALDAIATGFSDAYVRALGASVEAIHATVEREAIDCELRRDGCAILTDDLDEQRLGAALALGERRGWDGWRRIEPDEVASRTGIRQERFAGWQEGTSTWHPAKWVWGLLDAATRAANVDVLTETDVLAVEQDDSGYRVVTDRGAIRARHVVNATEAHTQHLFASFLPGDDELIRTHKSQAMYAGGGSGAMPTGTAVCLPLGWFHPRGDGFLFGSDNVRVPARQAGDNAPSRFVTSFMCTEAVRLWQARFRLLHEWTGTVGQAPDKFPVVGPLSAPGAWMLGGFAGAGAAISFGAGQEVARLIAGTRPDDSPWLPDLFAVDRFADPARYGERWTRSGVS